MTETRRIDDAIAPDGKSITITGSQHGVAAVAVSVDEFNCGAAQPSVAPADMQPPFEGPVEGFTRECIYCHWKLGNDDSYCCSCGTQVLDDEDADVELRKLIDKYAVTSMQPAMHARLRALVAGGKENKND